MRITDVHFYDIEYKTGTGTIVKNLLLNKELLAHRYGVDYSCLYRVDTDYRNAARTAKKGVKRNLRKRLPVFRLAAYFLIPIIWMVKQRRTIEKAVSNSDIIQSHDLFTATGLFLLYPHKIKRLAVFFHDNGNPTDMLKSSYSNWNWLEEIIIQSCHDWLLKRASHIFYVSKHAFQSATDAHKKYSHKFVCLPNSVSVDKINRFSVRNDAVKTVITVGTVSRRKRQVDLAKAFENARVPVRLIVLGEGPQLQELKDIANDGHYCEVQIMGSVSRELVNQFYTEAHVYAMASLNEGLPMSVLEAMAASLPIATVRTDGITDIVTNNINGCVTDDLEQLVAQINNTSIKELEKMGKNARKTIIEKYSLEIWIETYVGSLS